MALVFRRTSYYYRRRIPRDISIHIGLIEVCRSLRTMSRPEAWLRAAVYDKKFEEVCRMARGGNIDNLTRDDVESIVHRFRSRCFYELEEQIIDPPSEPSEFEREMVEDFAREEGLRTQRELMYNEQAEVDEQARELLTEMNMKPDPLSYEYKLLRHRLLETRAELAMVYFNALRGDVKGLRAGLNGGIAGMQNAGVSKVAPKLSVLIDEYKEFKIASKDWRPKTERENMQKLDVMLKYFTDKPIDIVDKKKANNFHNLLNALPVNFMKHMDKVPLKQLADKNKKSKGKTLAGKTVYDKYISAVKSFFKWAEDNDHVIKSPFSHIRGSAAKSKAQDDRKPLNDEDLKIAFIAGFNVATVPKPSHFWIPQIMLYTGARPGEIGQMLVKDIVEQDGVWCFSFNEEEPEEKHIKTHSSIRMVPVHPLLIDAGLLEFVDELRQKGERQLWPNLNNGVNGYANPVQKWFIRHRLRGKGIFDKKKVFYSLRHTCSTKLFDQETPENIVNQILGHEGQTMSTQRYDKGRDMKQLLSHIVKIDVPTPKGLEAMIGQKIKK